MSNDHAGSMLRAAAARGRIFYRNPPSGLAPDVGGAMPATGSPSGSLSGSSPAGQPVFPRLDTPEKRPGAARAPVDSPAQAPARAAAAGTPLLEPFEPPVSLTGFLATSPVGDGEDDADTGADTQPLAHPFTRPAPGRPLGEDSAASMAGPLADPVSEFASWFDKPSPDGPGFSRRGFVSQQGKRRFWPAVLLALTGAAPFVVAMVRVFESTAAEPGSWLTTLGLVAFALLAMAGMLVGFMAWGAIELRWRDRRRRRLFHARTSIEIDARGLVVQGLGETGWQDVLSLERVPDSDAYLLVHTARLKSLLLEVPIDEALPVFEHYLAQQARAALQALDASRGESFAFKSLVFRWPVFLAWIVAGYLAGAAAGGAAMAWGELDGLAFVLAPSALGVLVAWLVWLAPLDRIQAFSAEHVLGLRVQDELLVTSDGRWRIDLRCARVRRRRVRGIGYALDFISIRPERGPGLDLLPGERDIERLMGVLARTARAAA